MLNTRNEEKTPVFYSYVACFCEYIQLEYVRIHVIYGVNQAEYGIHSLVVAPQKYVNIYSTRRMTKVHRTLMIRPDPPPVESTHGVLQSLPG